MTLLNDLNNIAWTHPGTRMQEVLDIISRTHPHKGFTNSHLLEKSFMDWSRLYLSEHALEEYVDKVYVYCRTVENIDMQDIEDASRHKKMQRVFTLLDKFQGSCEAQEQKLFAIEDLRMTYYALHPFLYGLMLMFYDIKDMEEIDRKMTFITQWLEDIADACETHHQKMKKKNHKRVRRSLAQVVPTP